MVCRAKLSERGRLVIPAECRNAAGLAGGETLLIEVVGEGELRIVSRPQAIARAQKLVASRVSAKRSLAAELIAQRRHEARK